MSTQERNTKNSVQPCDEIQQISSNLIKIQQYSTFLSHLINQCPNFVLEDQLSKGLSRQITVRINCQNNNAIKDQRNTMKNPQKSSFFPRFKKQCPNFTYKGLIFGRICQEK